MKKLFVAVALVMGIGTSVFAYNMNPASIETVTTVNDFTPIEVKAEWAKKIPLRRGGTPEDVADVATFLASDMSSYVSGQVIQVDGGMNM